MASPYEYRGRIVWVGEVETFALGFQKRVFVVSANPDDKYPDCLAFELLAGRKRDMTGDVVENDVGKDATVKFYVSSRRWDKNGKVQWFTGSRAVEVTVERAAKPEAGESTNLQKESAITEPDPDNLPF